MKLKYVTVLALNAALSELERGPFNLGASRIKLIQNLRAVRQQAQDFREAREAILREITGVARGPTKIDEKDQSQKDRWEKAVGELICTEVELALRPFEPAELALDKNAIPYDTVIQTLLDAGLFKLP